MLEVEDFVTFYVTIRGFQRAQAQWLWDYLRLGGDVWTEVKPNGRLAIWQCTYSGWTEVPADEPDEQVSRTPDSE